MKRTLSKPDPYQIPVRQRGDQQQRDRLVVAMTVRMARAALGWSQAELGRFLGMSQRAIHRIEQGHSEPRRTTLLALESLLRKAGFKIEDRGDGGFSMVVPGAMLGESAQPDVAAPSLANFWPQEAVDEDEREEIEPARH
ncbi:MAG TPA: helix-turn-helix transcriptional regulator [Xanthobacteraceae bacterium]|jgi:transcriptional regulator with XRE-family HTH domain|nr:helix-turn-helix transcriptional regulator [Xanthobacteraceae bacterium]